VDCETGKRASLGAAEEYEALQIINAKNESLRQGWLNLQLGRVYLSETDSEPSRMFRLAQNGMKSLVGKRTGGLSQTKRWSVLSVLSH
jgi:hypothetical protein